MHVSRPPPRARKRPQLRRKAIRPPGGCGGAGYNELALPRLASPCRRCADVPEGSATCVPWPTSEPEPCDCTAASKSPQLFPVNRCRPSPRTARALSRVNVLMVL